MSQDDSDGVEDSDKTEPSRPQMNVWTYAPNRREQAILDKCDRVAFLRFLPTAVVSGLATLYGVNNGFLRPNPKLGALPKLFASTFFSYVLCQISVSGECTEAIKKLKNSPMADHIREKERKK